MLAHAIVVLLLAQSTGSISGRLTDGSGAAIGRAPVSLQNAQQALVGATESSGAGEFRFENVPVGVYAVTVNAPGFTAGRIAADVRGGQTLTLRQEQRPSELWRR
jgi:hypothetical protein